MRGGRKATADEREAELRRRVHELVDELMRRVIGAMLAGSPAELAQLMGALQQRSGGAAAQRATAARSEPAESRGAGRAHGARVGSPAAAAERRPAKRGHAHAPGRTAARDGRDHLRPAAAEARPSVLPHSPFDITSPGELLASTEAPRSALTLASARELPSLLETPSVRQAAADRDAHAPAASSGRADAAQTDEGPGPAAPSSATREARLDAARTLEAPPARARRAARAAAAAPAAAAEAEAEAESERRPKIVLREGEQLLSATGSGVVIRRARR